MTDFERPVQDPTTGPTTDTSVTEVPATPIATTPIGIQGTPTPAAPRRSRVRWLVALLVVALIVGVTAVATLSLIGSSPTSTVVGYVPADSVAYGELRLDLPGDQRQKIGEFLSKFPGFADQAALDSKLDEVLDRLLTQGTDGKQTYTRDIKPWFDGELAFSVGPLPADPSALKDPASAAAHGRAVILLSIKDEALARAWFTKVLTETGATSTHETYQGIELTLVTDPKVAAAQAAFALVDGKVAIVGDVASVKTAIDTKGASALAKDPGFVAAKAAMAGDDLGFAFVDLRTLLSAAVARTESMTSAPPLNDALLALVPDWAAFRLRVEGDALVMDSAMPHVDAAPGPTDNHANGVAAYAPPSTIAFAAGNDYGATLTEAIALYRKDPTLADVFKSVDQAANLLGGLDKSVGWMGDTGLVIARNGDSVEGGVISIPKDAAAGRQLLTTLRSFATLGGAQYGITVREEQHAGTTITIVDLGTATDLAALAGGLGGMPVPSGAPTDLPTGHVELAYAAPDGAVIIGSSPDFVRHALDAGAGQSLADDPRFTALVGRIGTAHTAISFVDIAAVRGLVEGQLGKATAKERADYEESVKPFLTPFDAFIGATVTGGALDQQHALITVK
jgi:Protein of unknown function (DUF3352)